MCAVSMVYDHYNDPYRQRDTAPYQPPYVPPSKPIPWPTGLPPQLPWTRDAMDELKEIIKRLDALDKKLGLEHCEDPKKGEWMQQIEERLKALENAAK